VDSQGFVRACNRIILLFFFKSSFHIRGATHTYAGFALLHMLLPLQRLRYAVVVLHRRHTLKNPILDYSEDGDSKIVQVLAPTPQFAESYINVSPCI
jgi:hypothetical protein